jgi:hypothetical protein
MLQLNVPALAIGSYTHDFVGWFRSVEAELNAPHRGEGKDELRFAFGMAEAMEDLTAKQVRSASLPGTSDLKGAKRWFTLQVRKGCIIWLFNLIGLDSAQGGVNAAYFESAGDISPHATQIRTAFFHSQEV